MAAHLRSLKQRAQASEVSKELQVEGLVVNSRRQWLSMAVKYSSQKLRTNAV